MNHIGKRVTTEISANEMPETYSDLFPNVPDDVIYNENEIELSGVLSGIAGTLQANKIIKIITGGYKIGIN